MTVQTYISIKASRNVKSQADMRLANILGLCMELLNICGLMMDDIMDKSTFRGGHRCWYAFQDVGLIGINDAFMIEHAVYMLLKKHFKHLDCYPEILNVMHNYTFTAICGQMLDMTYTNQSVKTFNMECYKVMAANKVAYDHFYIPFAVAMHLSG